MKTWSSRAQPCEGEGIDVVIGVLVHGHRLSVAVDDALVLPSARIGPDISVGGPWIVAEDRSLALAFKSGNFGGPACFGDALAVAGA